MNGEKMEKTFTKRLMQWHFEQNQRQMPWKGEKDPYKIWLSEIILQQTRVEQGMPYYNRFIKKYPTVQQLAKAPDQEVFKLWEGLGYYSRCKNLLVTARRITSYYGGHFPAEYNDLLALKGVGPYTAAAIASFAFKLPYAVVDGNVVRVLARYFAIDLPMDGLAGKKLFTQMANKLLFVTDPGGYNQAIMDFGAIICKPFSPHCATCLLQKTCKAYQLGLVNQLPIKQKMLQKKLRWFNYFVFETNQMVLVNKRLQKDIWENLYEFYLLETDAGIKWNETSVKEWLQAQMGINKANLLSVSPIISQTLTHQLIKGQFIRVQLPEIPTFLKHFEWKTPKKIKNLPFPRLLNSYLEMENLS